MTTAVAATARCRTLRGPSAWGEAGRSTARVRSSFAREARKSRARSLFWVQLKVALWTKSSYALSWACLSRYSRLKHSLDRSDHIDQRKHEKQCADGGSNRILIDRGSRCQRWCGLISDRLAPSDQAGSACLSCFHSRPPPVVDQTDFHPSANDWPRMRASPLGIYPTAPGRPSSAYRLWDEM
jgi:hypothetical protein